MVDLKSPLVATNSYTMAEVRDSALSCKENFFCRYRGPTVRTGVMKYFITSKATFSDSSTLSIEFLLNNSLFEVRELQHDYVALLQRTECA